MKCHQLTRTGYLLKQEACDTAYRAWLPNTDLRDKLWKLITKFIAAVSLQSQCLPPSPQEMKAMLPKKKKISWFIRDSSSQASASKDCPGNSHVWVSYDQTPEYVAQNKRV